MLPAFGIAVRMIVIVGMGVIVSAAHLCSFRNFFGFTDGT
jgi:hypothetical protein